MMTITADCDSRRRLIRVEGTSESQSASVVTVTMVIPCSAARRAGRAAEAPPGRGAGAPPGPKAPMPPQEGGRGRRDSPLSRPSAARPLRWRGQRSSQDNLPVRVRTPWGAGQEGGGRQGPEVLEEGPLPGKQPEEVSPIRVL